jgi:hypothetical protein
MIAGDSDTSDKFFAGINDTGEQFISGDSDTGNNIFHRCQVDTGHK